MPDEPRPQCGACGSRGVSGDVFCRTCGNPFATTEPPSRAAGPPTEAGTRAKPTPQEPPTAAAQDRDVPAFAAPAPAPLLDRVASFTRSQRTPLLAGLAMIVLCGGVTLALVLGGDDRSEGQSAARPHTQHTPEQSSALSASDEGEPTSAAEAGDDAQDHPAPPVRRRTPAPVRTIRSHFYQLGVGGYDKAFALMSARYRQENPGWVAQRSAADPTIRKLSVGKPVYMSGGAKAHVVFFARDRHRVGGSDTRCRRFEGTVVLIKRGGAWRYDPPARQLNRSDQPRAACS